MPGLRSLLFVLLLPGIFSGFASGADAGGRSGAQRCTLMIDRLIGSVADLSRLSIGRSDCRGGGPAACRCSSRRFGEADALDRQLVRRLVGSMRRLLRSARRDCRRGEPDRPAPPSAGYDWCVQAQGTAGLAFVSCNRCRGRRCCLGSVGAGSAPSFQCYRRHLQRQAPVAVKAGDELEDNRQDTKDDAEDAREPPEEPEKPATRPVQ